MSASRSSGHGAPYALAGVLFVYLLAELLPMAALPQLVAGLHASPEAVGRTVSLYAGVAAVAGIPLSAVARRLRRREVVLVGLAWLALWQLVVTLAPNVVTLVVARAWCGIGHVVVWGQVPLAAAAEGPSGRGGRSTGTVMVGSSLALAVGVPGLSWLAQWQGWRTASGVLVVAVLVVTVLVWRLLPSRPRPAEDVGPRPRDPSAALVALATVLVVSGLHLVYPFLSELAARGGIRTTQFPALLLGVGAAGVVGVFLARAWIDRFGTLVAGLTLLLVSTMGLGIRLGGGWFVVLTVLWGAGLAAVPVVLQSAVIRLGGPAADLASALYVVAYQVGIAVGTAVGGRTLQAPGLVTVLCVVCPCTTWLVLRRASAERASRHDAHR